jgi:hypothetical protein
MLALGIRRIRRLVNEVVLSTVGNLLGSGVYSRRTKHNIA